jgi:hypothetical protein
MAAVIMVDFGNVKTVEWSRLEAVTEVRYNGNLS